MGRGPVKMEHGLLVIIYPESLPLKVELKWTKIGKEKYLPCEADEGTVPFH